MYRFRFKFGSLTYNSHIYSILIWTREVTEQEKSVIFRQASGVRKIPQLKTDVLHCCSLHMRTHTYQLASINKALLKWCSGLHNCNKKNDVWRYYSLEGLCLCWKQVLCGHSCYPNVCCLAGTWWLLVVVRVQPWNRPPTHGKGQRSKWGSCAPDNLVQPDTTVVSGPGLMSGANRDDGHTPPGVTGSKYSPTSNPSTFLLVLPGLLPYCDKQMLGIAKTQVIPSNFVFPPNNCPKDIVYSHLRQRMTSNVWQINFLFKN